MVAQVDDVRVQMHNLTRVGLLRLFCVLLRLRSDANTLLLVMIVGLDLPLCAFLYIDGMLGREAGYFMHRLADVLCRKWEKPYGVVMGFVRARLSFAILKTSMLCVRDARVKWRTFSPIDGASIDKINF